MSDLTKGLIVGIGFIVLGMFLWITASYMEAQAFNRVTGKNVSTWDAMFIELRVQEPAMKGNDE